MIFLGLLPLTIIISLNCCIYWAVRRARIARSSRQQRGTQGGSKSRRSVMREAVNRYRGAATTEIELRELAPAEEQGQVRLRLSSFTY